MKRAEAVPYQIAWHWRDREWSSAIRHDDLEATNAEQGMRKLRKMLPEEYVLNRSDIVILEVYRI